MSRLSMVGGLDSQRRKENEIKRVCVVLLALAFTTVATAEVWLEVDDPFLAPSESARISIYGDGLTAPGEFFLGITYGDASLNIDDAVIVYPGNTSEIWLLDDVYLTELLGIENPFVYIELNDIPPFPYLPLPLDGLLIDNIKLIPEFPVGSVALCLFDGNGALVDSLIIYVPEPATLALLGLGGLMLRRRK